MTAPIALFAYRRPQHLRRTLQSLAANPLAAQSDLHVICDGPREPAAEADVKEVRAIARAASGFRSLRVVEREQNLGLLRSIVGGVSELTAAHGAAIVVEDDLLLAPRFLEFMNLALERYADAPQVMQVSGYMYPCRLEGAPDAGFLPHISCWGWATWQRAWQHFDVQASAWPAIRDSASARSAFDIDDAYAYSAMLERARSGELQSWGILWYLSVFSRRGLVLYPRRSLASNAGFDNSGLHADGRREQGYGAVELWDPVDPFSFPDSLAVDRRYYEESRNTILAAQGGWRGWLQRAWSGSRRRLERTLGRAPSC